MGRVVEVEGIKFKVIETEVDTITLTFENENQQVLVLGDGTRLSSDAWFKKFMAYLDAEVEKRDNSNETEASAIQDNERGEGEAKLLPDRDAREREDDTGHCFGEAASEYPGGGGYPRD